MDSDSDMSCTPPDIADTAKMVTLNLLPEKSRKKYEKQYDLFMSWCNTRKVSKYSENVLIAYFAEKSKNMKSSTLWSIYSMLKAGLSAKNNIDIASYKKLIAFLKKQAVGYKPKKSKTLSQEEILKFMSEAPDEKYLLKKVVLIMGIAGACRRDELVKMTVDDIEDKDSVLIVKVPDSKTRQSRIFTVTDNKDTPVKYLSLYRKYIALRPKNDDTPRRLFLRYNNGKCTTQVTGMNIIGKIPKDIAQYLKLPDCNLYTGHCFRRTSATLLVNGGGDIIQLKRHGGWKSSNVAEGYIEDCINNKIVTSHKILSKTSMQVIESSTSEEQTVQFSNVSECPSGSGIIIRNNTNCTFNININKN